jgi:hypothetical protein
MVGLITTSVAFVVYSVLLHLYSPESIEDCGEAYYPLPIVLDGKMLNINSLPLEMQLENAVAEENYLLAALLRDRIVSRRVK